MSNQNDPNRDPYEMSDEEYESATFNTFNADSYIRRRDDRPPIARESTDNQPLQYNGRASEPPPRRRASSNVPPPIAGEFGTFSPNAYLQQRNQDRGGYADPNEPIPLEGFDAPVPARSHQYDGSASRAARSQLSRSEYSIRGDAEPALRIGAAAFLLVVGFLLSACWISNIVMMIWYSRR